MQIYLDANAITKFGFNFTRTSYLKIAKLCADHGFSVVMHEVAKREVETQIIKSLLADIESAKLAAARIGRKVKLPTMKRELGEIETFFKENKAALIEDKLKPFHDWLDRCQATVLPISATDAEAVFSDYFEGGGTFSSVKNREDLPDGFILQGLKSLAVDPNRIVVICDDGSLGRAVVNSGFAQRFKVIDNFLESKILEDVSFDFVLDNMPIAYGDTVFEQIVASADFVGLIERCLEDSDWDSIQLNNDSESEPRIIGFDAIYNLVVELVEAEGNEIRVRCNFDADVELEYFILKTDAYCMSDDDAHEIHFEDWNKHVFLASTSTTLSFEVECGIYLDEEFSFNAGDDLEDVIVEIVEGSTGGVEHVWVSTWENE